MISLPKWINTRCNRDWLKHYIMTGNLAAVKYLIASGVMLDVWHIGCAAHQDYTDIVKTLLEHDCPSDEWALHWAARNDNKEAVNMLIAAESPVSMSAVRVAKTKEIAEIVKNYFNKTG